ncbi:MAG TPA: acyl-CoA carboxylase epsilon subunit [Mycobacteriales bacterium]|nr:acyl-CoA carboxylase epsilon subunit [Mycobacteriales bacterium]
MSETPYLSVVRGEPTARELAALVAVLAARSAPVEVAPAVRSVWADPARRLRVPRPGRGAWRRSALPG